MEMTVNLREEQENGRAGIKLIACPSPVYGVHGKCEALIVDWFSCLFVSGQRTLQHSGDVLDTQVVVNPAYEFVCSEVRV